jgi:hypothetical protein
MSDWDDFLKFDNFDLAWKRILRSRHRHNKDRIGLEVYGANLTTNLNHLTDKLRENVYNPSHAEKMYMPKPSGALRGFPFLYIEDRLVYQAIANIIVIKTKEHFEAITRKHVFAHLTNDPKCEFMLKRWDGQHGQYKRFLNRFQELLQRGYLYVMEADISIHNRMIHSFSGVDSQQICYIRENFTRLFSVNAPSDLECRAIFDTSYNVAVKSLFYAVNSHDTDPNIFVTALDDLNHIITIAINEKIEGAQIPRELYEHLLNQLEKLKPKYDDITTHFRKCHDLRCRNPLAHPYAKSLQDWSKDITHPEKDKLIKGLCISYQELTNIFAIKFGITQP